VSGEKRALSSTELVVELGKNVDGIGLPIVGPVRFKSPELIEVALDGTICQRWCVIPASMIDRAFRLGSIWCITDARFYDQYEIWLKYGDAAESKVLASLVQSLVGQLGASKRESNSSLAMNPSIQPAKTHRGCGCGEAKAGSQGLVQPSTTGLPIGARATIGDCLSNPTWSGACESGCQGQNDYNKYWYCIPRICCGE